MPPFLFLWGCTKHFNKPDPSPCAPGTPPLLWSDSRSYWTLPFHLQVSSEKERFFHSPFQNVWQVRWPHSYLQCHFDSRGWQSFSANMKCDAFPNNILQGSFLQVHLSLLENRARKVFSPLLYSKVQLSFKLNNVGKFLGLYGSLARSQDFKSYFSAWIEQNSLQMWPIMHFTPKGISRELKIIHIQEILNTSSKCTHFCGEI